MSVKGRFWKSHLNRLSLFQIPSHYRPMTFYRKRNKMSNLFSTFRERSITTNQEMEVFYRRVLLKRYSLQGTSMTLGIRAMEDARLQEKHDATLAWFSQFQLDCVIRNGVIPEWFHGIISRKTAEEMLLSKPAGHFLIRVSESRIGYTLSHRAEDRCRHFMIDVLNNGQYSIVGENTNHRSLQDLVAFHQRVPILPFNELLTVACAQVSKDKADYAELLFPRRKPLNPTPGPFSTDALHTSNASQLQPSPDMPPVLPKLPSRSVCGDSSQSAASTAVPIQFNPPRLYPTLDTEITKVTLQSPVTTNSVKPVLLPRKKLNSINSVLLEQAPELPSRNFLLKRNEQTDSGPHRPHQGMKSAVANFMHLKKKSQKKVGATEEHMYTEFPETYETVNDELSLTVLGNSVGKEPDCVHVYQELPGESWITEARTSHVHNAAVPVVSTGRLPEEYLTPPPFAPGY